MYSVLIMGGNDFISSSLAKYFINKKYNLDIMTTKVESINYQGIREHLICDRKKENDLKKVLKDRQYDYIYDLNAEETKDIEYLINNSEIEYLKKYILLLTPNNVKLRELDLDKFIENKSIPYVIIKSSNIYGYKNKFSKEMRLFEKIEKSIPIEIPKNKELKTQFIYIDDFVKVLYSMIKVNYVKEVYSVTNPQVISMEEYVETCGEIIGKKPIIKYTDEISVNNDIIDDFEINYLDIDKIIKHGLYIPNILLKNGIGLLYDWYKNNKQSKIKIKDRIGKVLQIG